MDFFSYKIFRSKGERKYFNTLIIIEKKNLESDLGHFPK